MPIVTITIRAGRPENEIQALMLSVHQALEEAFAITAADRNQRLVEIKAEHFFFPKRSTEAYTSIEIASFPGRSAEAKEQLFQAIYTRLGQSLGMQASDIIIYLQEPSLDNWGFNGLAATKLKMRTKT